MTFGLPPVHIRVEGHVHKTTNTQKCWSLSGERAKVIVLKMSQTGIPPALLHPKGFGASKPLSKNETDKKRDRRVEIHVMSQEEVQATFKAQNWNSMEWVPEHDEYMKARQVSRLPSRPCNIRLGVSEFDNIYVFFNPPKRNGGYPIKEYSVVCERKGGEHNDTATMSHTGAGTSSPIMVSGKVDERFTYSFRVTATTELGEGESALLHDVTLKYNRSGEMRIEERRKRLQQSSSLGLSSIGELSDNTIHGEKAAKNVRQSNSFVKGSKPQRPAKVHPLPTLPDLQAMHQPSMLPTRARTPLSVEAWRSMHLHSNGSK
jgi:hypothetical protein